MNGYLAAFGDQFIRILLSTFLASFFDNPQPQNPFNKQLALVHGDWFERTKYVVKLVYKISKSGIHYTKAKLKPSSNSVFTNLLNLCSPRQLVVQSFRCSRLSHRRHPKPP